jgi:hypothetical protein
MRFPLALALLALLLAAPGALAQDAPPAPGSHPAIAPVSRVVPRLDLDPRRLPVHRGDAALGQSVGVPNAPPAPLPRERMR